MLLGHQHRHVGSMIHLFVCSHLDEINRCHNRKDVVLTSNMTCQSLKYHVDCIDSARSVCESDTAYTRHGDTSALKRQWQQHSDMECSSCVTWIVWHRDKVRVFHFSFGQRSALLTHIRQQSSDCRISVKWLHETVREPTIGKATSRSTHSASQHSNDLK